MQEEETTLACSAARPPGYGRIVAASHGGRTVLARADVATPLRLVQTRFAGTRAATVCLVTFGGGLVDGDVIDVDLSVEANATLIVFTQSSTKAFRGTSKQTFRADVRGTLVLVPDPVAAFAGARYSQRVDVTLHDEGSCVLLDGYTSGRAAYGERWAMDRLDLRNTVTRDGAQLLVDGLRLDARDGSIPARTGRFEAFVTVSVLGPRVGALTAGVAEPCAQKAGNDHLVVASGVVPAAEARGVPSAIARIAATSPWAALEEARRRLRNLPEIEAVDPFSRRN